MAQNQTLTAPAVTGSIGESADARKIQVRAAVLEAAGDDWTVADLALRADNLGPGDVLVRMLAAGLCHSDEHIRSGDLPSRFPLVGGHEGAAVVEAVGPGAGDLKPGDHVVLCFRPACGNCRFCARGQSELCDKVSMILSGEAPPRFFRNGEPLVSQSLLGTFATHSVVPAISCVPIPKDVSPEVAALLGCAVPTGYGAAVHAGKVASGDAVIVVGMGGVGTNAVQGARCAGAALVVAVDNSPSKLKLATDFGADAAFASLKEADSYIRQQRGGIGADVAIMTVGVTSLLAEAVGVLDRGGRLVLAALGHPDRFRLDLPVNPLAMNEITIQGTVLGSCNLREDIPRILSLYKQGRFKLDELISHRYTLDQIRDGYEELARGEVTRAVIVYEDALDNTQGDK